MSWDESIVWDRTHLAAYTGGDKALERQVVDIFLSNAPGYLLELAECEDRWRPLAHKLKGAARGIGAWNLAGAAERAETMRPPPKYSSDRKAVILELKTCMERLLHDLDQG